MDRIRKGVEELCSADVGESVNGADLEKFGLEGIKLRPYQLSGVNWLIERYARSHGCILGDEMGLGKTCQTISFLVYLYGSQKNHGPHLILCPLSVIGNWKDELNRFAPKLKLLSYLGDKDTRGELRDKVSEEKEGDHFPFHVLLTTYEVCLKDSSFLAEIPWRTLVVDEAHRLKNQESLLHQTLKGFTIEHHILLTGTPIQNNLTELYSLLCFVAPHVFKWRYLEEFLDRYSDVDNSSKDRNDLHKLLKPFILRRVKNEVLKDLPKKSEVVLYHGLTALQKKYYKAILTKDTEAFESGNPYGPPKTRLMNILMQLRKCVDHPYLFDGVEPEPFELGEHLVEASGKLVLIDQLLAYLRPRGHKVLLFSQMTRMLDIIQDYLGYRGYSYERLDGSVRGEERFLAVQNFNQQDDTFIFLLSTKAGGQGLNLVSADTVIFVDSDFNPQNDLQAAARAHRIGQKRAVKVLRLIGRSTVEEIVLRRAEAKLKLTQSVIEGGQFSLGAGSVNKEALIADDSIQLQDILKFGVDQLFDSEEGTLEEVDFDQILGPTKKGHWQSEDVEQTAAELADEEEGSDDVENMYVFEGKDYSKGSSDDDKKAFDQLLAAEVAKLEESTSAERSLRKKKGLLLTALPDVPRKPRKQLTEEEKEERKRKRAETAARRAQEAEEEEVRRAQERRQRREEKWAANNYTSCNVELDSEGEEEEEEEDGGGSQQICYVSGDVTHPSHTGDEDAFIAHCVDDSGHWGSGGLFSALSARSQQPEIQYELAGSMRDLALGDTHIIPVDDLQSREKGSDMAALIVTQHRDRKNKLSGIKLPALEEGLQRLYKVAKQRNASVHLPRIGYNTPGFNWYGTERLIRKWLAAKGIPTYIYYYPRKKAAKRRHLDDYEQKSKRKPSDKVPSASSSSSLPVYMQGVNAYFHHIPEEEAKKLKRYLVAYPFTNTGDQTTGLPNSISSRIANSNFTLHFEAIIWGE
ncbi:chromodomain-helicase-DNA-binding protein 1-like [Lingula anatina]|uniref:Chromodomain-helicase-DNA-binding protein 1-like n=1 Tax=Lingula anatina TaxID=7574 RepID=A0A1S3HSU4_LINAN|nr:chromodomain-helicase-DNA-binding protein 1-like [Lingula anatina]|eukprot:XP_013389093.1 chromodomain-helicase-DNA-binding protein 1-like [Lingula anatina]